jgi:hypothetical protein
MRVLWFTNVPLPGAQVALGKKASSVGGWLDGLSQALVRLGDVEIFAVTFRPADKDIQIFADGIKHFHLSIPPKKFAREWS